MSRRRPTDGDAALPDDALPLPVSADLSQAKRRSPTERAGRFFRTRPVSSLLLILALCAVTMLTVALGRYVGTALTTMLRPGNVKHQLETGQVPGMGEGWGDAKGQGQGQGQGEHEKVEGGGDGKEDGGNEHGEGEGEREGVSEDEKGTLVDGAADGHGNGDGGVKSAGEEGAQERAGMGTGEGGGEQGAPVRKCVRKYEPGKLGWEKTLCVTDEFFFDISIGADPAGTMKIGVFGEVVPKSAANFRALATCTGVFADDALCYRGDAFHRVVTNFVAQGGSKATGRSIYGPTFREEKEKDHHSFLQHAEKGVVSWAEYPIGSQFFVMVRDEAKYLDGNHVVFGIVTEGLDVLDKIHDAPRNKEEPMSRIVITDCGDANKPI